MRPGRAIAGLLLAAGEIIAFPDDDCWYSPGLLREIDQWFRDYPKYSVLAVGALDEAGIPSGNRWLQIFLRPASNQCISYHFLLFPLFLRRDSLRETSFDEGIGPGSSTVFGCGDETDLVLSILNSGFRGRFDRSWHIGHPRRDMLSGGVAKGRAVTYGCGMGRVLRRYFPLYLLGVGLLTYDVLRGIVVGLRGRLSAASLCFAHAWGLIRGFSAGAHRARCVRREVTAPALENQPR